MSTKGGPVFTFTLPGRAARPLAPLSVTPLHITLYAWVVNSGILAENYSGIFKSNLLLHFFASSNCSKAAM